jgi:putative DNA primase/helicase
MSIQTSQEVRRKTKPVNSSTVHSQGGQSQNAGPPEIEFPPESKRPCFQLYKVPFISEGTPYKAGVYWHFVEEETDDDGNKVSALVNLWILSVLEVLAIVRTTSGREHSYLIEYIPHGEIASRFEVISQAALLGRAEDALKTLRAIGVSVLQKHAKLVQAYLDNQHLRFGAEHPEHFWESVKHVGWHGEKTFVLPNEIIGEQAGVCFSGNNDRVLYEKAGSFQQWNVHIATPCRGNDYLVLALSSSFAGPLLKWLGITAAGFHFYGDSTVGKSTAQYLGVSSWAPPSSLLQWRATANGLEGQAACRCDTFFALDESQQADPKMLDLAIYMLINGCSKQRMNRDGTLKEVQIWRLFLLSSGERSLEIQVGTAPRTEYKAGQAMRFIDVPVQAKYGLFDDLHGYANGKLFSEALLQSCHKYYGYAALMFVEALINKMPALDLHARLETCYQQLGSDLSAQEGRVARTFACVALAGELATEWNILPWKKGEALAAARNIFDRWRKSQPQSTKSREHAQILEKIVDFISAHRDSRFSDINWAPYYPQHGHLTNPEPIIRDRAGYWDDSSGERIYLFSSSGLKEATKGFELKRVTKALEDAGAFTRVGTKQKSVTTRLPNNAGRDCFYYIDPSRLQA